MKCATCHAQSDDFPACGSCVRKLEQRAISISNSARAINKNAHDMLKSGQLNLLDAHLGDANDLRRKLLLRSLFRFRLGGFCNNDEEREIVDSLFELFGGNDDDREPRVSPATRQAILWAQAKADAHFDKCKDCADDDCPLYCDEGRKLLDILIKIAPEKRANYY